MFESFPSFRLASTSRLNPILELDALIINRIMVESIIIMDWLFIEIGKKDIIKSVKLSRHNSIGNRWCWRETIVNRSIKNESKII